ncbi:MAG: phosphatase PAP2 family protein [Thermodesulfobacteriota bacterium]|nr:MAG: phosphatase PAP2 family protein [Thermodesulfobacteriota bacterium]
MDFITGLDIRLFRLMNTAWTSQALDPVMAYATEKLNFVGMMIVGAALVWILGRRRDFRGLFILPAAVLVGELMTTLFKFALMRPRPCQALEGVRLLVGCPSSYSLPSGHATAAFAAMVFLSARHRRFWPLFIVFAAFVAYTRPYAGVHYPADIAAGALLGTFIALAAIKAEERFFGGAAPDRGRDEKEDEDKEKYSE